MGKANTEQKASCKEIYSRDYRTWKRFELVKGKLSLKIINT